MWSLFSVFLGKERQTGFFSFIAEENFFMTIDVVEGLDKDRGRGLIEKIKDEIKIKNPTSLHEFEDFIIEQIKTHNLPLDLSLAVGLIIDNIFYLKTIGGGKIYLSREGKFNKIVEGGKSASGYIKEKDFYIFTNEQFIEVFGEEESLKNIFDHKKPNEIVDNLTPNLKGKDDQGAVALFVQMINREKALGEEQETMVVNKSSIFDKGKEILSSFNNKVFQTDTNTGKKKTLTFIIIIALAIILFWSVGLGVQRRKNSLLDEKIKTSKEMITQKITQADEVAFLNLPRALILVSESKTELVKLKKEVGQAKVKEIEEIETLIKNEENKIVKKEEKGSEEFFDLTIDNKEASGTKLYLSSDSLAILDNKKSTIYLLSLDKKSIDKRTFPEIKLASLIGFYQDEYFFFTNDGLYKITTENKLKKVVEKDKDWGQISDLWVYNGNIYLLDKGKDEVYKYLVAETGYSEKNSYIKSDQKISLKPAGSMAIDSSVYISFVDYIVKFTAGLRDGFKTDYPEDQVNLSKVFTSKDLEKVYAWDKTRGVVYILSKNGVYERQIKSTIISKANDLVVYERNIFLLFGSKIYKITTD